MATITREDMADRALEHIGVKSSAQSASAEDTKVAEETFDTVYNRLRKLSLAPFASSAVPEWAQGPFKRYVAAELAITFGISGQRLAEFRADKMEARQELAEQVASYRHPIPVKASTFNA